MIDIQTLSSTIRQDSGGADYLDVRGVIKCGDTMIPVKYTVSAEEEATFDHDQALRMFHQAGMSFDALRAQHETLSGKDVGGATVVHNTLQWHGLHEVHSYVSWDEGDGTVRQATQRHGHLSNVPALAHFEAHVKTQASKRVKNRAKLAAHKEVVDGILRTHQAKVTGS